MCHLCGGISQRIRAGVRTIASRFRFHWTTGSIDWAAAGVAPISCAVNAALASAYAVTHFVTVISVPPHGRWRRRRRRVLVDAADHFRMNCAVVRAACSSNRHRLTRSAWSEIAGVH